jgi:hypothetical protein
MHFAAFVSKKRKEEDVLDCTGLILKRCAIVK